MILGVGTDLVEVARIEAALVRFGPRLLERLLSASERQVFSGSAQPARWLAKRFAAKEAAAKALGTGMAAGVGFRDFVVSNDALGRPLLALAGVARQHADRLGVLRAHLSLSDTHAHALAFVVLEAACPVLLPRDGERG